MSAGSGYRMARSPCVIAMRRPSSLRAILIGCLLLPAGALATEVEQSWQVEKIVAAISPVRIEAAIRKLVGFHTRHTLSETESPERGIGSARRWIRQELEKCRGASGGRLQVEFDSYQQQPVARVPEAVEIVNVVATLPGTRAESRDRIYVVSGHYDSRASDIMDATGFAPGANDDASGVAAVMEMACVIANYEFDATLVFMAVAGEEQGLLGARHWGRSGCAQEARPCRDDHQRHHRQLDRRGRPTRAQAGASLRQRSCH